MDSTAHELRYDLGVDVAVVAGSAALLLGSELIAGIKPTTCRWCDRDGNDESLNGLDRSARDALRWSDPRQAHVASGVTTFLLEPAVTMLTMMTASTSDKAGQAIPP